MKALTDEEMETMIDNIMNIKKRRTENNGNE
jgi:hypothetical protein